MRCLIKIVAFGHRKRVGKDTSANFLISALKTHRKIDQGKVKLEAINILKIGFATKVKDIAFQIYSWAGLQQEWFYDEHPNLIEEILPRLGKTPRQLWIGVGNGIRAATGYDGTWGDYVFETYRDLDYLFIKDLRFPAEAEMILHRGGLVYRVDNPTVPKVTDGADDPLENWTGWTGIINNNGTLHDLHAKLMAEIFPRLI